MTGYDAGIHIGWISFSVLAIVAYNKQASDTLLGCVWIVMFGATVIRMLVGL